MTLAFVTVDIVVFSMISDAFFIILASLGADAAVFTVVCVDLAVILAFFVQAPLLFILILPFLSAVTFCVGHYPHYFYYDSGILECRH